MKLIDKSAIVAEIEKYISNYKGILNKVDKSSDDWVESTLMLESKIDILQHILSFLDSLEVKDVDEIIKNAEDHAYFAGSENTREKLIDKACKWWEVELTYPSMTPEEFKWYKNKVRKFRKDMEDK